VTRLAFAAERRAAAPLLLGARWPPLSLDISCAHGAQQQTRRILRLRRRVMAQTDRRTVDGRTHTMLPGPSASEVATLWRYTNLFIIIIFFFSPGSKDSWD